MDNNKQYSFNDINNVKVNLSDKFVLQILVAKYRRYLGYGLIIEDFNLPEKYKSLNKAVSPHPYENMFVLKCSLPEKWEDGFKYNSKDINSMDLGNYKNIQDLMCHDFRVEMENLIYSPMKKEDFLEMRKKKLCGVVVMYKIRDDLDLLDNGWTEEDKKDTEKYFDELIGQIYTGRDNDEWNIED